MYFAVSWWYTQLRTLQFQQLGLLVGNGYVLSNFFSPIYTTEVLPSSIPTSKISLKNWESSYDVEQHTRLSKMAKLKHRTIGLPVSGKTTWAALKTLVLWRQTRLCSKYKCNFYNWEDTLRKSPWYKTPKPQRPMSSKLELYRKRHKLSCSDFRRNLPPYCNIKNSLKSWLLDNFYDPNSHNLCWNANEFLTGYTLLHLKYVANKPLDLKLTEIDST